MEVLTLAVPGGAMRESRRPAERHAKVAIGSFDGVHLGHRQVLYGCDTVLTFEPHPMRVLDPRSAPSLLSDRRQKLHKLGALGIRRVAIVPFDEHWSQVTADEFVDDVVVQQLGAELVSVGQGFRFGAQAAGTTATFDRHPQLSTRVVPLVTGGRAREPISSTRIRRLIFDGAVEEAAQLLGAPLVLPAAVTEHGRLLIPDEFARPAPGVYLGYVDGGACAVRVCHDQTVEVLGGRRAGTHAEVVFVQRTS